MDLGPVNEGTNAIVRVIVTWFPETATDALDAGTLHSVPVSVPVPPGVTDCSIALPWLFAMFSVFDGGRTASNTRLRRSPNC